MNKLYNHLLIAALILNGMPNCFAEGELQDGFELVTTDQPPPGKEGQKWMIGFERSLVIAGYGVSGKNLLDECRKAAASRKLTLLLNGIEIPGLRVSHEVPTEIAAQMGLVAEAEKVLTDAIQAKEVDPALATKRTALTSALSSLKGQLVVRVVFVLSRDSEDEAMRKAWDALFHTRKTYDSELDVGLGFGGCGPWQVHSNLIFVVAENYHVRLAVAVGVIILICGIYLACTTNILRDHGQSKNTFSLGRTQMMFWGMLVFATWAAVAVLTLSMEHIPAETLVLLGISAATGLGSVMIKPVPKVAATDPSVSKGFITDLITSDNAPDFHRVQILIWTLGLGIFFVVNVTQSLSMPVFSSTLLTLMGISNGTYLGFKSQE
jgi:hypothetical protein